MSVGRPLTEEEKKFLQNQVDQSLDYLYDNNKDAQRLTEASKNQLKRKGKGIGRVRT